MIALRILFSACDDVAEFQRNAGRQLFEDLDHHRMRGLDAPVQRLAAIGLVVIRRCRETRRGCAAGCPARRTAARWCRWRRAPRPASSRDAARRPARTAAAFRDRLRCAACCAPAARSRRERRLMSTTMPARSRPARREYPTSRWCRPGRPSAECWPVRCSDRSDPTPAAAGVWSKSCWLLLSWNPRPLR